MIWVDRLSGRKSAPFARRGPAWACAAIFLWLLWPGIDTGIRVLHYRKDGIRTYSTRAWAESELIGKVDALPPDALLFSNAPDAVYIRTGREARFTPYKREEFTLENSYRRLDRFSDRLQSDSTVQVAWFARVNRPYLYSIDELRDIFRVELIGEFADGSLYRVSKQ
jgi:hypothetical protein